ncbi:MAG: peptidase M49, partial [Acidobacteria bacterium]|nr:peptidase M49 [Acidobacteriota bacterium]
VETREYLLEQVDNFAIVRLYADGFDELSMNDKLLAYHLYQASIAGDPIIYDQLNRFAPRIKRVLEMILTHSDGIDSDLLDRITIYTKKFWANGSHYSIRNKNKTATGFTYDEFKTAAVKAMDNGADFGLRGGETLDSMLAGLERTMFNMDYEPLITVKTPPPGEDIITASANNFYEDVTLREVEAFNEQYALNSRLVKQDGYIVEQVYRSGDENIPAGRYAKYIKKVIYHLREAAEYANNDQKDTIQKLIRYYQTGTHEDWYKFNVAWVNDAYPVDFINGFIESYIDPRSLKATFESFIFFVDKNKTKMMNDIAGSAEDLEADAPWDDDYKKKDFSPPQAKAISVLIGTGDGGPQYPLGINLPNEQDLREKYGTKSVLLTNAIESYNGSFHEPLAKEFCYSDDELERAIKFGIEANNLKTALHEVVGHGSGKVSSDLKGDSSLYLKEYYSTLEEARAELMALWSSSNPVLLDKQIMSSEEVATAMYESYARAGLLILRRIKTGNVIEDDHMRATNLIVHYWLDKKSIELKDKDSKLYLVVNDLDNMKEQVGELLKEIMRIKAEGDYDAAKKLVEKYAVKINPALRDDVVRRCKEINYPDFQALVAPGLKAIKDGDGNITDVVLDYSDDFKTQMLRWSEYIEIKETEEED